MLGCRTEISNEVKNLFSHLALNPITVGTDNYVLFSEITTLSDCLNLKNSQITRFSKGDILDVPTPVFLPSIFPILFKVKEMPSTYFCTQEFKNLIDAHLYTGLIFEGRKIKSKSWF